MAYFNLLSQNNKREFEYGVEGVIRRREMKFDSSPGYLDVETRIGSFHLSPLGGHSYLIQLYNDITIYLNIERRPA